MKKLFAMLLTLSVVLSVAACGPGNPTNAPGTDGTQGQTAEPAGTEPGTTEPGATEPGTTDPEPSTGGSSIAVSLASEPDNIDPAMNSAVDGATMIVHLFSGLAKWGQAENGDLAIMPDAAEELVEGVENEDGTVTYTYTLRDGMTWSDGEPVTAQDFEFAWQRAASQELAADYNYMFEVIDGYADVWAEDASADAKLNVTAVDEKTLEVTLANAVSYWDELLAFPTYFPVREDVVSNEGWATDPSTYISNGPYKMTGWEHNSVITLEKNPDWYEADTVTMDKIEFYLSDDSNNMLANFKSGAWQLIDDVPTNEIAALQSEYADEFFVQGQIGTYYVSWNVNKDILPEGTDLTGDEAETAKAEIRNALALLFDRNYVVNDIAQGGQVPASSFVAMGMTDADGTEFYKNAGSESFDGYYDVSEAAIEGNFAAAMETLKKYYAFDEGSQKFTDFPTLNYLYNTSEGHKAIGEYLQSALATVGITMNLENQEWNTFLNTRKEGNYDVARNGWIADYNDPISFLDMWTSGSGNNDVQFGKGDHAEVKLYSVDLTEFGLDTKVENGTWAETYDALISAIKTTTDLDDRYQMMHMAEDLLMSTGAITPIYFYTDLYMLDDSVKGFYSTPLGYKFFTYATVG